MKCRGVKKRRELVREEKGEAVAEAAASFCVGNFEKET